MQQFCNIAMAMYQGRNKNKLYFPLHIYFEIEIPWNTFPQYCQFARLYSEIIMSAMSSKSPGPRFTQPFVQAKIKENIRASRHWPLWEEFSGARWISHTKHKGSVTWKMFPFVDVIMIDGQWIEAWLLSLWWGGTDSIPVTAYIIKCLITQVMSLRCNTTLAYRSFFKSCRHWLVPF